MQVTREVFDAIQREAVRNYEKNGNDYIVETLDLAGMQEIADTYKCRTDKGLAKRVKAWAKLVSEVESDIRGA